jgi:hypothetical protein
VILQVQVPAADSDAEQELWQQLREQTDFHPRANLGG